MVKPPLSRGMLAACCLLCGRALLDLMVDCTEVPSRRMDGPGWAKGRHQARIPIMRSSTAFWWLLSMQGNTVAEFEVGHPTGHGAQQVLIGVLSGWHSV